MSPSAALRILRSIAYPPSATGPAPDQAFLVETLEEPLVLDPGMSDNAGDSRDDEAVSPAEAMTRSAAPEDWYLNEVPADWLQDLGTDDRTATPVIELTEPAVRRPRSKSKRPTPAS